MRRATTIGLAALLAGCPIGNDRYPKPADLTPGWRIDKLRVLAVRADPPEVQPGQEATFEALVVDPSGESSSIVWLACPPADDDGVGFGCELDPAFDFTTATPDELADAGFIGFEPLIPPRFTAPADALDDLSEFEARDGTYYLVQVAVIPNDAITEGASFDFNEVEVAYKRLVISDKAEGNLNPTISAFTVDRFPVPEGTVIEVDPSERYELGLLIPPDSIEVYSYTNDEGVAEQRTEQPYVKWYADGGTMFEDATLYPFIEATWRAPEADADITSGTWWSVVRDRRGGMSWIAQPWRLRSGTP